jgi:hypothetical protein
MAERESDPAAGSQGDMTLPGSLDPGTLGPGTRHPGARELVSKCPGPESQRPKAPWAQGPGTQRPGAQGARDRRPKSPQTWRACANALGGSDVRGRSGRTKVRPNVRPNYLRIPFEPRASTLLSLSLKDFKSGCGGRTNGRARD